ncbi:MAG: HAMP domain-containing protein [Gammaproteobacteria bacterium]|nr:HAMP domain-containing protein [Gammaproteobacteria bacterium]
MTRIFLKLYGGILVAFLVLFLVSYLVLSIVNHNRYLQYQQGVSQGVVGLMGGNLDALPVNERLDWLSEVNREFNIGGALHSQSDLKLGRRQLARLLGGIPISEKYKTDQKSLQYIFYRLKEDGLFLGVESGPVFRDLPSLTLYLIVEHMAEVEPANYQKELKKITGHFAYTLSIRESHSMTLNHAQETRLQSGGTIIDMMDGLGQPVLISKLFDSKHYLLIGPIQRFNEYPFMLVMIILLIDVALLGCVAYILVRPIEKRLAGLSRAAKQIKKGNLEVRAEVGSSDAIGFLADAFNAMAEHIQMLLDMQTEMIRAVSHELRTPVARMRFSLQLIEDVNDEAGRLPLINGMDDDMQELDELIDEILTYAKMEHSAPELEFILLDVDGVMNRIQTDMGKSAEKNNIVLEHIPESLPHRHRLVEGDERYLHRVIQNFVGNAIRYAQGQVRMSFLIDGVLCKIVVEDDGPGIPEEEWGKVFAPFARLDTSRNRASGGYGLGLSIVQRIVNWHHGRVSVEKSSLGGAMFIMEWPVRQPDAFSTMPLESIDRGRSKSESHS